MTYATPTTDRSNLLAGISNADFAASILRVTLGVLFLAHVWMKLVLFTPAGTVALLRASAFRALWLTLSSQRKVWVGLR